MYPLYLLGILALVITIQRFFTSTRGRLAPKNLAEKVNACIARKDYDGAVDLCKKSSSTLGNSLGLYRGASGMPIGKRYVRLPEIWRRGISGASFAYLSADCHFIFVPLVRIVRNDSGNDRGFRLVALFGDEGGASILSDSISKALITTQPVWWWPCLPLLCISFSRAGFPIWVRK